MKSDSLVRGSAIHYSAQVRSCRVLKNLNLHYNNIGDTGPDGRHLVIAEALRGIRQREGKGAIWLLVDADCALR